MANSKLAREAGFNSLGQEIYLKRPSLNDGIKIPEEEKALHPTVILLFGWMGAKLPHLIKYAQGYEKIYPAATLILIRCQPASFWKPKWMQSADLHRAVEALEALGCITATPSNGNNMAQATDKAKHRILMQTFSNGGCLQLTSFSRALAKYKHTNVSASAMIFDSCPGSGSLDSTTRAFSSVIPFTPLRMLVLLFLHVLFFFMNLRKRLFGVPMFWDTVGAHINQPSLFPWVHSSTPRLYIYSTTDELVPWKDVESHAKGAEKTYINVIKEKYEGSMHVAHLKHDPDRYWRVVQNVWNMAC